MTFEIVVAHYNENLGWLTGFNSDSICVYSKGSKSTIDCKNYQLPNVGREAHTYLTYIVQNYENLPNIVFFTQGNPHDHIDIKPIYRTHLHLPSKKLSSTPTISNFSTGLDNYRRLWWAGGNTEPCDIPGDEWFRKFVDSDPNINLERNFSIFWGAVFSVRKEAILSRPKSYYELLLTQCQTKNPETAHFFERSWYYIFNLHTLRMA